MSIKQALSIKQMKFTFKQGLNIGNQSYASKMNMRNYVSLTLLNRIHLNLENSHVVASPMAL